jgi:negative regulator of replication initiation
MKSIEIEDDVYSALEKRVQRFGETPNDIIKRLLEGSSDSGSTAQKSPDKPTPLPESKKDHPLIQLITSPRYLVGDGKERYFAILSFLYQKNPDHFSQLEGFKRGSRVNISKDVRKIESSGTSTNPQKLNGTPYYVMTNLDNKRKREILQDVLRLLRYPQEVMTEVIRSIPDSGISRPKRNFYAEY